MYLSVNFFLQKYAFNLINKLCNNLKPTYAHIINFFYKNISLYTNIIKESLLIDYLQKMYLSILLKQWFTSIALYVENSSLIYSINKVWKLFDVDVYDKTYGNIYINFFLQTFILYCIINICVLIWVLS